MNQMLFIFCVCVKRYSRKDFFFLLSKSWGKSLTGNLPVKTTFHSSMHSREIIEVHATGDGNELTVPIKFGAGPVPCVFL